MKDIEQICMAMETTLAKFFSEKEISHEAIKDYLSEEELKGKLRRLSPRALAGISLIIDELLEETRFEAKRDIPKLLEVEVKKGDILRAAPYNKGEYALFLGDKAVCSLCDENRRSYYQALS